jgi:MFS family permease
MGEAGMAKGRKNVAFIGLCIVAFMAMFFMAGVGTYAYAVAAGFDAVAQVGIIFTLESVARTVTIPLSGKIGDKVGRKKLFVFSVALYIIAYAIAAFSTSFWVFTIARTITGFAWGLFVVNIMTIISDVFGQNEGPRYAGIAQAIVTIAMIAGAPVAGVFASFNWRAEFYVGLPIMLIGFLLCVFTLPKIPKAEGEHAKMDVGGCIATCVMLVPFSLAMNWANTYGWGSPLVIGLFIVTAIGLIILIPVERKAASPLYPGKLLTNKYYLSIFMISFAYSFASGVLIYVPTFAQYVLGTSATLAGIMQLPGLIIATVLSAVLGNAAAKHGRYRGMVLAWTVLALITGIMVLFTGKVMETGMMAAFVFLVIAQTPNGAANGIQQIVPYTYPMKVLKAEDLAVGMAFMGLGGPLGTTIATGISGALMNSSGGMLSLFYVPIFLAVVMVIFSLMFRDVKTTESAA